MGGVCSLLRARAAFLADSLMEQGNLAEAETVLARAGFSETLPAQLLVPRNGMAAPIGQ